MDTQPNMRVYFVFFRYLPNLITRLNLHKQILSLHQKTLWGNIADNPLFRLRPL